MVNLLISNSTPAGLEPAADCLEVSELPKYWL